MLKPVIRGLLGLAGLEAYRARGGVFICPKPSASRHQELDLSRFPSPYRLHLGCGNVRRDGYVNIDLAPSPATDLVADITQLPMFPDRSVQEIRLEAVMEHLFRHQRLSALREWRRVLVPGGRLHILHIPDFDVIADHYVNRKAGVLGSPMSLEEVYRYTHGDPVPHNAPEQIHKDIFTRASLERDIRDSGLALEQIENALYRDEPIALNLNLVARRSD